MLWRGTTVIDDDVEDGALGLGGDTAVTGPSVGDGVQEPAFERSWTMPFPGGHPDDDG